MKHSPLPFSLVKPLMAVKDPVELPIIVLGDAATSSLMPPTSAVGGVADRACGTVGAARHSVDFHAALGDVST